MPLLENVSHRKWRKIGRIATGFILVVLLAGVIALFLQNRSDDDPATTGPSPGTSSAPNVPTSPKEAVCTPTPMVTLKVAAKAAKGPSKQLVAGFEAAAVLHDPDQRSNALIPFATCEYITASLDAGHDDGDVVDDLEVRVSDIVVKHKKVDKNVATFTAQFTVESRRDGVIVDKAESQSHTTTWVWTKNGWRVYAEPE